MNKTLALVALLGLVSAPAFAYEAPAKADKVVAAAKEAVTKEVAPAAAKDAAAPAVASKEVAAPAAVEATHAELKDGTKVTIKGEEVFVVGKDGKETAAPDAKHELKDGTFVTTKGGKIVK